MRNDSTIVPGSPENLFMIYNFEILEETSPVGPFLSEMATAHLCCGVLPTSLFVCHLSSPCNTRSAIRQDREKGGWPISHKIIITKLQPPVSMYIVLPHCTCHVNQFVIFWKINEGIKTNERGKKRSFLCKTTWTLKFSGLKNKLGKHKLCIEKILKP